MEYAANKSLKAVLERVRCGSPPPFWSATGKSILICGIALGMRYIHWKRFIHRDLKPGNILINENGHALISDFGTVCSPDLTPTPETGTVQYAAPEMLREGIECTAAVDVFSFGSIVYEIVTGKPVFDTSLALPIVRQLSAGEMPEVADSCGWRMRDLIRSCWSMKPESRPSFHSIVWGFQASGFEVVPEGRSDLIKAYVDGVCDWEANEHIMP
jgi:serine/threonine protein kinase